MFGKLLTTEKVRKLRASLSTNENLNQTRRWLAARIAVPGPPGHQRQDSLERPPIFFVIGSPRSGTNWVMRTINAHPEILCKGEGRFFGRNLRNEHLKGMQTSEHIRYKIQPSSLQNALMESEYLRLWVERSVWTRSDDTEEQLTRFVGGAVYHFLTEELSKTGKRIVGDKTPLGNPKIVEDIRQLCPEAKLIHIIRDGRDVAISQLHHIWNRSADVGGVHDLESEELSKRDRYREDPWKFLESGESIFTERSMRIAARQWESKVGAAYRDGPEMFGDNYTEVRYEDLLKRPEQEFERLFEFLGACADEKTVARCVSATSFEKRSKGRERGKEDSSSGARKGIAGDWENVLTGRDRAIFKDAAGSLLVELGYETDHNW